MDFVYKEIPYQRWGPWRNQWGYVTEIAQFDEDDILLKTVTPYNRKMVRRFVHWEDCAKLIELIEQDRRF